LPVNLDKREFVMPHKLGTGLKLWEQLANHPGTGAALLVLCTAMPEPRGGGDFDLDENWHGPERTFPEHNISPGPMPEEYQAIAQRTIGRWAGDRIALVGDYAEDSDLPNSPIPASRIYAMTSPETKEVITDAPTGADFELQRRLPDGSTKYVHYEEVGPAQFTDISDDVARVIEHELGGKYEGTGWRHWVPQKETA
jgi:hypothetical protein